MEEKLRKEREEREFNEAVLKKGNR